MTALAQYWFKPKTHGYGTSPANRKGGVATVVFVIVAAMGTMGLPTRGPTQLMDSIRQSES